MAVSETPVSHANKNSMEEGAKTIPSALFLVIQSLKLSWQHRVVAYGYVAWLIIPTIVYLFGLGLNGPWQDILLTISDSASLILSLWVYATILLYIAASLSKAETEKINFAAINQRAWSILLTLFIAQLLIMLAAALGFILLIIPGLIIWTWTAFASQEIVLNARSLWEAFKVSRSYTKGRLWPILGRLIVGNGLLSLAMVTVFAVYVLLGSQGHLNAAITSLNTLPTWTQVGTDILALPFIPPLIIFQLLLYVEVKKGYSQDQT